MQDDEVEPALLLPGVDHGGPERTALGLQERAAGVDVQDVRGALACRRVWARNPSASSGAELGAGAMSSARSCAAEAQRQRRSELGCDGSAARSPVGELGRGRPSASWGAELGGGAVSSARRSPLKKVTFKTMTCGPLFTVANTVLIYPSIVCYGKQTQNLSVL